MYTSMLSGQTNLLVEFKEIWGDGQLILETLSILFKGREASLKEKQLVIINMIVNTWFPKNVNMFKIT